MRVARGTQRRRSVEMDVVRACIQKPGSLSPWVSMPRLFERCSPKGMCRKASRKYLVSSKLRCQ
tara:strand:+ start:127 stop:318 length:192 start_codon:yes stop_codon:yes gene_type:complete